MTPLSATAALSAPAHHRLRLDMMLRGHKWDTQVGDVGVLCPYALVLPEPQWRQLQTWARELARETLAAEAQILPHLDWLRTLALPRRLLPLLTRAGQAPPPRRPPVRVMRFDFHWTTAGWRVSECNGDVPGGFVEASTLTRMMAGHFPHLGVSDDPTARLVAAIGARVDRSHLIALVHATAYSDDRQVMHHLAHHFSAAGFSVELAAPDHLHWHAGRAHLATTQGEREVGWIVRFFPAEWLGNLPRSSRWEHYFAPTPTPQCNPGAALVTQSKRWPLLWDRLSEPMTTWRQLCPATADPRRTPRHAADQWVYKPALGRVGEGVGMAGVTPPRKLRQIQRSRRWFPGRWAAQERFTSVPIATPDGPRHVCLGVFVIDGAAAGIYARVCAQPLINGYAQEAAVLIAPDDAPAAPPPGDSA